MKTTHSKNIRTIHDLGPRNLQRLSKRAMTLCAPLVALLIQGPSALGAPTTKDSVAVPAERPGYQLVWHDEFDTDGLPDPGKWVLEEGFQRNQELQFYRSDSPENTWVEDGVLTITARKVARTPNPLLGEGRYDWARQREHVDYTSASLRTDGIFSFTYGRVEVRAELPEGKGAWPAIWLLGENWQEVGWPRCGEIDVMEWLGREPNKIHGSLHWSDPTKESINKRSFHRALELPGRPEGMNVYAMEWTPERIDLFFNGENYFSAPTASFKKDMAESPFDRPMVLLINLAIGGSWGRAVDDSALPMTYKIDWVRVYQRESKVRTCRSQGIF